MLSARLELTDGTGDGQLYVTGDGRLWVVSSGVTVVGSADGGRTWSAPRPVPVP